MKSFQWSLGVSCSDLSRENFEAFARAGIPGMEISLAAKDYAGIAWKEVDRYSAESGVRLFSFHLPFSYGEANLASFDPGVTEKTLVWFENLLGYIGELRIPIAVVHASSEPIQPWVREEYLKRAEASLAALAGFGKKNGVTIAVENLPRTCLGNCSSEILRLISVDDSLRVCFDTNHLLDQTHEDFIRSVGDKIVTTHISDYDFRDERHWMPGDGKIRWDAVVAALREVGYRGNFTYEVSRRSNRSIERPKTVSLSELRENYEAIMEGRTPSPLGTPIEEFCRSHVYYGEPKIR